MVVLFGGGGLVEREEMARLMRPALRALSIFASPRIGVPLEGCRPIVHTRHYIGEMAKMAFESNILRLLRIEMDYHKEYAPSKLVIIITNQRHENFDPVIRFLFTGD